MVIMTFLFVAFSILYQEVMIRKYKKEGVDELAEIVGGETGNNRLFRERRYNPSLKLALIERETSK